MKFFLWESDQEQGPFNEETVQSMITNGQIPQDTLMRLEDSNSDWIAAKDLFPQDNLGIRQLKVSEKASLEIYLNSGAKLKIKSVCLYDEIALASLNAKKAEAVKKLQGVSIVLGSIGSIEWVIAASAAIGAVESILSANASTTGVSLLKQAIQAEKKLRREGVLSPVDKIQNIENPIPCFWRTHLGKTLVHNGDEFVVAQTDDQSICSIRWSAVERYIYSKAN